MIRHVIPVGVPEMPLEKYIKRAWPMLPGHALRELLSKKDVRVNGVRSGSGAEIRGGDELTLFLPVKYEPQEIRTVYRDEHLIVAVKPQGLPVDVDQDGIGADTLLTRLQAVEPSARLCHRLDAATGGLVMAALDDETEAQALEMFKDHKLQKTYLAVLRGGFEKKSGTLRAWLKKDAKRSVVQVLHRQEKFTKPIETRYRVLDERGALAYAELEPVTGRTHQLRAHMADFGHPIIGDDRYGDRVLNRGAKNLMLWCAGLYIGKDSPLEAYRGQQFLSPKPDWWKLN